MTTQLAQEQGSKPVVGLALGSGSARGWAHIGIIQALEDIGVQPQVVAGTSIGALVGGAYVTGSLDAFADWVETLTVKDVFGLLDISFSGGMVKGEKLFGFFREHHANPDIETLDKKLVTVATDMQSGREVWITEGKMLDAARASCALPGLFSPVKRQGRWMLDGGLVNGTGLCRPCHGCGCSDRCESECAVGGAHGRDSAGESGRWRRRQSIWNKMMDYFSSSDGGDPASSMGGVPYQYHAGPHRVRMAGDPPEVTLVPCWKILLMDFHQAKEAIEAGRALVSVSRHPGLGRFAPGDRV